MKIPNTVRISGVDYAVTFVSNLNDGEKMLDGCVDYNMSTISLNSDTVGYQRQCIVLWHEILHALIENSCVKLDMEKEEEIVEALSLVASTVCCRITVVRSLILSNSVNLHRREHDLTVTPGGISDVHGRTETLGRFA